ncbi:MAG: hypothetical protein ACLSDQ_13310 [Adlercreutzia equolifaciens]
MLSPWKPGTGFNRIVKSAAGSNYENGGWDAFVGTTGAWGRRHRDDLGGELRPSSRPTRTPSTPTSMSSPTSRCASSPTPSTPRAQCGTQTDIMGSAF